MEAPSIFPVSAPAVYLTAPGRTELRQTEVPAPGPGELLMRIDAALVCGTDVKVFRRGGHPTMLRPPSAFGHEMAGTLVGIGDGRPGFEIGQRIAVANSVPCGECDYCRRERENLCRNLAYLNGAFARYLTIPARFAERACLPCPDSLPAEVAALAEPLACVLHCLETLEHAPGGSREEDVIVLGSGPIGLLLVHVLRQAGHRVTSADPNPSRLRVASALGAVETVLVERGCPAAVAVRGAARDPLGFDAAIDATGTPSGWRDAADCLRPGGRALLFGGCPPDSRVVFGTGPLHYDELIVQGVYHHRPATFARALDALARGEVPSDQLLTDRVGLAGVESALRDMAARRQLKVIVDPWA